MIGDKAISIALFAGAFGLDLGMEKAGFHTVSLVEIEPAFTKTIALNRPHLAKSAVPRDIRNVDAQTLLAEGGHNLGIGRPLLPGEVDIVTGGPPCQSFSVAGRRGSLLDSRGSLFKDFIRIIEGVRPRFFLMENVRGLLSVPLQHRPLNLRGKEAPPLTLDEMPGSAIQVVIQEMKRIGYTVSPPVLLEAADYGVPQKRCRVFILGSRDGEPVSLPSPTHSESSVNGLSCWQTLRQALTSLDDPTPEYIRYSETRLRYLSLLSEGQNWRDLPAELQREAMGGAYNSSGGRSGFYRRLAWDRPCPTVTTSPCQKAGDMCHPDEVRPLSVKEYARVQTFPDDWIFYGSRASKYRQIGNAIPTKLAELIGKQLYRKIHNTIEKAEKSKGDITIPLVDFNRLSSLSVIDPGKGNMTTNFHEMLAYGLEKEAKLSRTRARSLASFFADVEEFMSFPVAKMMGIKSISGKPMLILSEDELKGVEALKTSNCLSLDLTVAENHLALISRDFTRTQLKMVKSLNLDRLSPNPFLIRSLNLNTPEEVIRLNVYMSATRSIVTSMGFFIEKLLVSSSDNVERLSSKSSGGWDLLKSNEQGEKVWMQIKSGPNNMDKDQVVVWAEKLEEKIAKGDKAYIGFTYGKRSNKTVTIGLLKKHIPDWEAKTLIGRELWDFVSADADYSSKLFEVLRCAASKILHQHSIAEEIEACATRITQEFISKYGQGANAVDNYIDAIF